MPHLSSLRSRMDALADEGLLRRPDDGLERSRLDQSHAGEFLDLTSNDYLGLAAAHVSRETLTSTCGAGASRLIHGTRAEHLELERELASWTGLPEALLFASGYAANVGALGCLLGPGEVVISDALNHASLIDGCRLSRATIRVVPHGELEAVRRALDESRGAAARWVVVESYYSMDGDSPDLAALRGLCDRFDAHLYVDEAHALGVFGPQGAGRCAEQGVRPDILLGGLGKACGVAGGFVASSSEVRTWLWNRARSFVFSTAPSPALARTLTERARAARGAEALRTTLHQRAAELRQALAREGVPLLAGSHGPIVAVPLGAPELALRLAERLKARGILVQAIRPPTVPDGTSRVRLTVNAGHTRGALQGAARLLAQELAQLRSEGS